MRGSRANNTFEAPEGGPMPRKYHFISGLPRSGSTLLAAILRQNPRFHAGMSSPVAGLMETVLGQVSAGSEMAPMVNDTQRAALLTGIIDSFYREVEAPVIFDTSRAWTATLPLLMRLFPDARLVCCVRDVAWIMDSLERQVRQNAFEHTRLFASAAQRATVYTRVDALAGANSLVGFPWHALKEACYGEHASQLVMIEYDLFVRRPAEVMRLLYEFLGEAPFEHDFSAVSYDAPEFDAQLGVRGLHKVHPEVAPRPRETILPPDLFERYASLAFWRTIRNSRAYRIVEQPTQAAGSPGSTGPDMPDPVDAILR
jgi:sulfotransferase